MEAFLIVQSVNVASPFTAASLYPGVAFAGAAVSPPVQVSDPGPVATPRPSV